MLLQELGTYLQTAGIGILGQTLILGSVPLDGLGSADTLVALIELGGSPPVRAHDGTRYELPHVQVWSRGEPHDYAAARAKAQAAWDVLDGLANQTLSGVRYLSIQALGSVRFLKTDDYHRKIVLFDIRCARAL